MDADLNPPDAQVVDQGGGVTDGGVTDGGVTDDPATDRGVTDADIDAVDVLLNEVEQSLARLDAGTYGRCEECGESIDDARLAEFPTALRCRACVV